MIGDMDFLSLPHGEREFSSARLAPPAFSFRSALAVRVRSLQ